MERSIDVNNQTFQQRQIHPENDFEDLNHNAKMQVKNEDPIEAFEKANHESQM